jgi:hypothetical protein
LAGDLDRDGEMDLVVAMPSSNRVLVLQRALRTDLNLRTYLETGWAPQSMALGDLNDDGQLDVVTVDAGNNDISGEAGEPGISVLFGEDVGGTFSAPIRTQIPGGAAEGAAFGDLNGDGRLDIALSATQHATILIYLGNADGTFTNVEGGSFGFSPSPLMAGDLNNDGMADLVGVNASLTAASPSPVTVWLATGGGTFAEALDYVPNRSTWFQRLADVNGDGLLDLVGAGTGNPVLMGRGDGTFGCTEIYDPDLSGNVLVGDLNRDGKADLALTKQYDSAVVAIPLLAR